MSKWLSANISYIVSVLIFSTLLTGCTVAVDSLKSDVDIVKIRAQERVNALLAKDLKKAYEYTTPAFKEIETLNEYHARYAGAGLWTAAEVGAVDCFEDLCTVTVNVRYQMKRYGISELSRPIKEKWIQVDGNWWIYHKI